MVGRRFALMSIKPSFSTRIFSGGKRFELRRAPVSLTSGDIVVVYASAPVMAIVGAFEVGRVMRERVSTLWRRSHLELGVSPREYEEYFDGAQLASAIEVRRAISIPPLPLASLRLKHPGFRPPQSYKILRDPIHSFLPTSRLARLRVLWWPRGEVRDETLATLAAP